MTSQLKILFMDNPYLSEEVCAFCETLPEFREAEGKFYAISKQIAQKLGRGLYLEFEEAQSDYLARLVNAYYLFGLGLRQEVLAALQPEIP